MRTLTHSSAEHELQSPLSSLALFFSISILKQDMDDMDADLFAPKKKPSSAPAQTKALGNEGPKKDSPTLDSDVKPGGPGQSFCSHTH